jgi:hypothetical protein
MITADRTLHKKHFAKGHFVTGQSTTGHFATGHFASDNPQQDTSQKDIAQQDTPQQDTSQQSHEYHERHGDAVASAQTAQECRDLLRIRKASVTDFACKRARTFVRIFCIFRPI